MNQFTRLMAAAVFLLSVGSSCLAQPQYYGLSNKQPPPATNAAFPWGGLFRVNADGLQPEHLAAFDTTGNRQPIDLTLASNGRIYGVAVGSQLIEYDPVTDSLSVVYDFDLQPLPWMLVAASSLVEGASGVLYGTGYSPYINEPANVEAPVFSYRIGSDTVLRESAVPGFLSVGQWYRHRLNGALSVLPDGRLLLAQGPSGSNSGAFGLVDTVTNAYITPWTILFDVASGIDPNGDMILTNAKYYSTTRGGGIGYEGALPQDQGNGVIYAYDAVANTYEALHAFTDDSTGRKPLTGMVLATNGKMYGQTTRGVPQNGGNQYFGTLFSFDPVTEVYEHLVDLGKTPLATETGQSVGDMMLAASNGKIYGSFLRGLFAYDPALDTLTYCSDLNTGYGPMSGHGLIELCRKPNYKPRATSAFSVCAGSYFFYDLQNVNATSVVWRRNGAVVPNQTNQLLEFAAISAADAGVWTCTMTNQCGVTEPPAITITVNAGAITASDISGDTLLCGIGDSAVLTGNSGGIWSTGATTPALIVVQPGTYYAYHQQACGLSMSNALHVTHLDSAKAPTLNWGDNAVGVDAIIVTCPGQEITFSGNETDPWSLATPGLWSNGASGASVNVQDTGLYFVTVGNACSIDTSNVFHVIYLTDPPLAQFAFTDAFGQPADVYLCTGDSVSVSITNAVGPFVQFLWQLPDFSNVFGPQTIVASQPGQYSVTGGGGCTPPAALFMITADGAPPQEAPMILPDQLLLTGCDQDTAYLSTTNTPVYWTWTDASNIQQNDTAQSVQVDRAALNGGLYILTAYNGCGTGPQDSIYVQGTPAPVVLYTEGVGTVCVYNPAFALSAGAPVGGTYTGTGVVGTTFDPVAAGIGTHAITYTYSDGTCTGYAQDSVVVDLCTGVGEVEEGGLLISPNPNMGTFTLNVSPEFTAGTAMLYDAKGKAVGSMVRLAQGTNTLGSNDLAPGVYTVQIDLDGTATNRLMVVGQK